MKRLAGALLSISPQLSIEMVVLLAVAGVMEGFSLLLLVPLLQLVGVDPQQGSIQGVAEWVARAFNAVGTQPTLGAVLVLYLTVAAVQGWLERRRSITGARLDQEVVTALRTRLYNAIVGARWAFFSRGRSSEYTQVLTEEVDRVGSATYLIVDLAATAVIAAAYIGMALWLSPVATGLVVVCGAALLIGVRSTMARAQETGTRYSAASARLYAAIAEHLGGMKLAKSYGAEGHHAAMFARLSGDLDEVTVATADAQARLRQRLSIGSAAVLAAIVYVSSGMLTVSTAQLLLLLFLFARVVPRLSSMYERAQALAAMLPSFDIVSRFEAKCRDAARSAAVEHARPFPFERSIAFERVSFNYGDSGAAFAVNEISLAIEKGSTTAIVGPSGAGKSTLADLLMGLLEPSSGRLLIDGRPLTADVLDAWRAQIGYVPQDPFLFHDTVRANLLWARPGASDADIREALELACAAGFVAALPQGLDTIVGDRGVLLSGGERQRLALARALLRRPALLILDEATSSLDFENERRIQQAIDDLQRTMTIVVITHRLSTVRHADVIHVVEHGRIIESGTWDALQVSESRRFAEMSHAQAALAEVRR